MCVCVCVIDPYSLASVVSKRGILPRGDFKTHHLKLIRDNGLCFVAVCFFNGKQVDSNFFSKMLNDLLSVASSEENGLVTKLPT